MSYVENKTFQTSLIHDGFRMNRIQVIIISPTAFIVARSRLALCVLENFAQYLVEKSMEFDQILHMH